MRGLELAIDEERYVSEPTKEIPPKVNEQWLETKLKRKRLDSHKTGTYGSLMISAKERANKIMKNNWDIVNSKTMSNDLFTILIKNLIPNKVIDNIKL